MRGIAILIIDLLEFAKDPDFVVCEDRCDALDAEVAAPVSRNGSGETDRARSF